MSLEIQCGKLAAVTVELTRQWEQTRPYWLDAKCEAFEKDTLDTIRSGVNATLEAMRKLDELMRQIRRDCE